MFLRFLGCDELRTRHAVCATVFGVMLAGVKTHAPRSLPPSLCVYIQNVPVCTGNTSTCFAGTHGGRFECTHGGVLDLHTGCFSVPHPHPRHTPHTHQIHTRRPSPIPPPPHTTPHHTTPHHTQALSHIHTKLSMRDEPHTQPLPTPYSNEVPVSWSYMPIRRAVRVLAPLVDSALRETHARQYSLLACDAVGACGAGGGRMSRSPKRGLKKQKS